MHSPDGGTGSNDAGAAPAPSPAAPPTDDPLHAVFLSHAHADAGGLRGGGGGGGNGHSGGAPFGPTLDAARFARLAADSGVALERAAADALFARAALAQGEAEPRLKGTRRVGFKIFRDVLLRDAARELRPRCTAAELRARVVRAAAAAAATPVPLPVAGHLRRAQTMPASAFPTRKTMKQQRAAAAEAAQQQQQHPQLGGQPQPQPRPRAVSFRKRAEMEFKFVDEKDTVDGVVEGRAEGEGFRVVRGLDVTLGRILTDDLEEEEAPVEGTIGGERRPDVWTVSREEYRRVWRKARAARGLSTKSKFALPCADLRLAMPEGEESEEDVAEESEEREDWGCGSASRSRGGGGGGETKEGEDAEEGGSETEAAPLCVDYDDGL